MFLDPLAALIILVPIFLPIAAEIGVDPVHFGIIVVVNLMIGLCTPPVGYLIYMTASIADVSPTRVVRESMPFVAALVLVLVLITYLPELTLAVPRPLGFENAIRFATPLPHALPAEGEGRRTMPREILPPLGGEGLREGAGCGSSLVVGRSSLAGRTGCVLLPQCRGCSSPRGGR